MPFRFVNKPWLKAQFQWEPRDMWVGLFWRKTEIAVHLYICLVPLLPLHVTVLGRTCPKDNGKWDGSNQPCRECGATEGTFSERGFNRCNKCGYPGQ